MQVTGQADRPPAVKPSAVRPSAMKPGQDLVIAGYIGLRGTSLAAAAREAELLKHFTPQYVKRCQDLSEVFRLPEEAFFRKTGATEYKSLSGGGVMNALWQLFSEYKLGFEIELRDIPILQETVEVCEIFDLNPYRLDSAGCVLLSAENGGDLVRDLRNSDVHGAVIGKVKAGIKRQILNGEIISYLDRPKPDELYKIQLTGGKL